MSLNIYFCGSIRAGRGDVHVYSRLVELLSKYGNVLTPFVADKNITEEGSEHKGGDRGIHDRDMELLDKCDAVVAEVTQPSLGVGYEIGRVVAMGNKKILCLYRPSEGKKLSAMIAGLPEDVATVKEYNEEEAADIVEKFFA